jgi:hypothetical protein
VRKTQEENELRHCCGLFFRANGGQALALHAQYGGDCIVRNTAFSIGEKVTYKVVYNWNSLWLNAGEVDVYSQFRLLQQQGLLSMIGYGATYKSYDWFYKVRDTYESFIDMQTLQPLRFIR